MKVTNIQNKYARRTVYWLAMPLAYIVLCILLPIALIIAAFQGAWLHMRWHYADHWKGTMSGPWAARKHM